MNVFTFLNTFYSEIFDSLKSTLMRCLGILAESKDETMRGNAKRFLTLIEGKMATFPRHQPQIAAAYLRATISTNSQDDSYPKGGLNNFVRKMDPEVYGKVIHHLQSSPSIQLQIKVTRFASDPQNETRLGEI